MFKYIQYIEVNAKVGNSCKDNSLRLRVTKVHQDNLRLKVAKLSLK